MCQGESLFNDQGIKDGVAIIPEGETEICMNAFDHFK